MYTAKPTQRPAHTAPWQKLEHDDVGLDKQLLERLRILVRWLYPEVLPYRSYVIGNWLLLTLLSAVSAAPILLARNIVRDFEESSDRFHLHLVLLAVVILAIGLLRFIGTLTASYINFRVRRRLEEKYVRRLAFTPLSYYESNTSGSICLAAFNQMPFVIRLIDITFRNLLQAGTTILVVIVALFYSDVSVGVFSIVLVPFFFIGVRCFGRSTERSVRQTFTRISDLHSYVLESLISVKTIRTLGLSDKRIEEVGRIAEETVASERRTLIFTGLHRFTLEIVFAAGAVGVLLLLHSQFVGGRMSLSLCAAALTGFGLLAREIKMLAGGFIEVRRIAGACAHIIRFLREPENTSYQGGCEGPDDITTLCVRDVTFSYDDVAMVLQGINLTVSKGRMTGIVGMSGAGKSTLVDLILRLRVPTRGQILVDGRDLATFSEDWIRRSFALVDQEPFLFNTTIRENLLLSDPALTTDDIETALKAASAWGFVSDLPDRLDSVVGEGGCLLSVGQKQRIALARALIRKPSVLVLDEITSALDAANEDIILDALGAIAHDRLIVLISHKERVMACCDRIYRLERGQAHLVKGS